MVKKGKFFHFPHKGHKVKKVNSVCLLESFARFARNISCFEHQILYYQLCILYGNMLKLLK